MRVAVEATTGCEEELNALAKHFRAVTVDNKLVPSERVRRLLRECSRCEGILRPLRGQVRGRSHRLVQLKRQLAAATQNAEETMVRLQRTQQQLGSIRDAGQ